MGAKLKALKEAANICERMIIGGRAWTKEQEIAGNALMAAAREIKAYAESGLSFQKYLKST
jgi:hypothetical protein